MQALDSIMGYDKQSYGKSCWIYLFYVNISRVIEVLERKKRHGRPGFESRFRRSQFEVSVVMGLSVFGGAMVRSYIPTSQVFSHHVYP